MVFLDIVLLLGTCHYSKHTVDIFRIKPDHKPSTKRVTHLVFIICCFLVTSTWPDCKLERKLPPCLSEFLVFPLKILLLLTISDLSCHIAAVMYGTGVLKLLITNQAVITEIL